MRWFRKQLAILPALALALAAAGAGAANYEAPANQRAADVVENARSRFEIVD